MSYRKRYRKRKPRYRKRQSPWGRRLGTAAKALAVAYSVKKLLNVEYKVFDAPVIDATVDETGSIHPLNKIPSGDTFITRDGNQCKMVSMHFKGTLLQHPSTIVASQVRISLLKVTHQDSSDPTVSGGENGMWQDATMTSFRNMTTDSTVRNRYICLWNQVYNLAPADQPGSIKYIEKFWKMPLKFVYKSSATNAPNKNSLWMVIFSDEDTNTPTFNGQTRIRFIDN